MAAVTNSVFEIAGDSRLGAAEAVRWTAGQISDVRRWLADRDLTAPDALLHAYDLAGHGLAGEEAILIQVARDAGDGFPRLAAGARNVIGERLAGDVVAHVNASAMVAARAPLRLAWLDVLLCPLYVDEHRELVLPTWLTAEIISTLLPSNDLFPQGRACSMAWVVLEAPVVRKPGTPLAKFASFFAHQGSGASVTWHWRGIDDLP